MYLLESTVNSMEKLSEMDEKFNRNLTHVLRFSYLYLIIRFKLDHRLVSVVTHRDFDGAISAAIVLHKHPYARLYFATQRNLYHVLYAVRRKFTPSTPQTIYILDLNVSETYRTRIIKAIKDIRKNALVEIHWIDHHRSVFLDEMEKYVDLYVDPTAAHAAYLVQRQVNDAPATKAFLDILHNAKTPAVEYWSAVLKVCLKHILQIDLRTSVMRSLATFTKTPLTDDLYGRYQRRITAQSSTVEKIHETAQGYRFGLLPFNGDDDLYPKVRETLKKLDLDFLVVEFGDGSLSAYKNRASDIDLTSLLSLVGGKGHAYAFHFDPQRRVTDEFYRPLSISDLIETVKEVL